MDSIINSQLTKFLNNKNKKEGFQNNSLKDLENKFQKLLSEYSTTHKIYMNDVMDFMKSEKNKYINKLIQTPNKKQYYVNNYGQAREINNVLNPTCGSLDSITKVNTNNLKDLNLEIGVKLENDEICGYDGKNIKVREYDNDTKYLGCYLDKPSRALNKQYGNLTYKECEAKAIETNSNYFALQDGGAYGWEKAQCFVGNSGFDKYGSNTNCKNLKTGGISGGSWGNAVYKTKKKNINANKVGFVNNIGELMQYKNGNIENTSGTCPTIITEIDESLWEKFKKGENMSINTLCNLGNIDKDMKNKLIKMNQELINIAQEIQDKIKDTEIELNNLQEDKYGKRKELNNELKNVKRMFNEYDKIQNRDVSINAMVEDQMLRDKSSTIEYTLWTMGSLTLIYLIYSRLK